MSRWTAVASSARSQAIHHALAAGITRGFLAASGIALAGLVITAVTIRVRREDLAGTPEPAQDRPAGAPPALEQARS
jgi:stage V sporulation protein SpoVS